MLYKKQSKQGSDYTTNEADKYIPASESDEIKKKRQSKLNI